MSERPPQGARPPITDSYWFWVELFSGVAFLAILAIGPKFVQRQAQIERRFEGRQHAYSAKDQAHGDLDSSEPIGGGANRVSLAPLLLLTAAVMVFSAVMLMRERTAEQRSAMTNRRESTE